MELNVKILLTALRIIINDRIRLLSIAKQVLQRKNFRIYIVYIQGVPGRMCQTSGGCSLC